MYYVSLYKNIKEARSIPETDIENITSDIFAVSSSNLDRMNATTGLQLGKLIRPLSFELIRPFLDGKLPYVRKEFACHGSYLAFQKLVKDKDELFNAVIESLIKKGENVHFGFSSITFSHYDTSEEVRFEPYYIVCDNELSLKSFKKELEKVDFE